jgi:hypothetical protein
MINNKYIIHSVDQTDLTICDITTVLEPSSYTEGGSSVYEFLIGEVTGVVYLTPQQGVSWVVFDALNNFVQSLEDAETNFNVHTFFRFIMAATIHHQTQTGIQSLTYRTNSAQKHRIYQLMSTRTGIPAVNEWESQMTEGGVD